MTDDEDDGAPPAGPGVRIHTFGPDGSPKAAFAIDEARAADIERQKEHARAIRGEAGAPPAARRQARQAASPPSVAAGLVGKFPDFDASWPDDIKKSWFEDFKQLMEIVGKQ